jgi:hypothetical protein
MTRTVTPIGAYLAQKGLFARVAKQLGLDPSYVSRVACGHRQNQEIIAAIEAELNKVDKHRKIAQSSGKKRSVTAKSKT